MSSLHKRAGSPFWWGKFRDDTGTIRFRSTKKAKRDDALEIVLAWQRSATAAQAGELTKAVVLKTLNEILERTTGERLEMTSVRQYVLNWLKTKKETGKSKGTVDRYKPVLESFLAHLGEKRASISISGVTVSDIENFRSSEQGFGKAAASVNLSIKILRAVFSDAKRKGLVLVSPAEAVELIDQPGNERSPFADEEIRKLLVVADLDWRGMILLGAHLGLRIGDAAKLRWSDINLEEGKLAVTPQKTARRTRGKPQLVALHPELCEYFEERAVEQVPSGPVFPILEAKTTGGHQGLSNAFSALVAKTDIEVMSVAKRKGRGRGFNSLTYHSLRHAFVSRLANADVSADVRKEIVGHSSDEIHRRYTHLDLTAQHRALQSIKWLREKVL